MKRNEQQRTPHARRMRRSGLFPWIMSAARPGKMAIKAFLASFFLITLMSCSQQELAHYHYGGTARAFDGAAVATDLQSRYNDTRLNCGATSKPAFLCSGILLRGTNESLDYHSWNPNPAVSPPLGVAFSFLRTDAKFAKMAIGLDNGFIFYPVLNTPPGKVRIEILCSYPLDGYTWVREPPGCGQSTKYPVISRRCQSQGITTAEQWMAHYRQVPDPVWLHAYICSFDVRDQMNELAADSFYQSIRAMNQLGTVFFNQWNELVLASWPQNIPATLPIQAFFYTLPSGLKGAQHDQWDFNRSTPGLFIPIIKVTLPSTQSAQARFEYIPSDQYITPP